MFQYVHEAINHHRDSRPREPTALAVGGIGLSIPL